MSFLNKIPDTPNNTSSNHVVFTLKPFSIMILVVGFIFVLTLGIGFYFQNALHSDKSSTSLVGMAKTATEPEKQRLAFLEEKLKNRERLTYRERKEFVDLLWIVKGIRLFDCDEKGENYFKELGVLTGYDFGSNDLDWRGKGKTLDEALKEAFIRTKVPIEEFEVIKWAKDKYGKSRPVLWRNKHNSEVNIDSPHIYDGPDVFHVGYQTEGKKNIVGHILMDCLPYFRDVRKEND